jgi:hypothetical protein
MPGEILRLLHVIASPEMKLHLSKFFAVSSSRLEIDESGMKCNPFHEGRPEKNVIKDIQPGAIFVHFHDKTVKYSLLPFKDDCPTLVELSQKKSLDPNVFNPQSWFCVI